MGTFMFASMVSRATLNEISSLLDIEITLIHPKDDSDFFEKAIAKATTSPNNAFVFHGDDNITNGYAAIFGVTGSPIALIQVSIDQRLLKKGQQIANSYFTTLTFAVILLSLLGYYVLHKKILLRLGLLMDQISHKENSAIEKTSPIAITGNDEIHELSVCINRLIEKNEHSKQTIIKKSEEIAKNEAFLTRF